MWHNDTFSQRKKVTNKAGGGGDGQNLKKGISNIGSLHKIEGIGTLC